MYYLFIFYLSPLFYAYEHFAKEARRGCLIPLGLELQMMTKQPYRCWESRWGPLEEQPMILITEPPLEP